MNNKHERTYFFKNSDGKFYLRDSIISYTSTKPVKLICHFGTKINASA